LTFSEDAQFMLSSAKDGTVVIWRVTSEDGDDEVDDDNESFMQDRSNKERIGTHEKSSTIKNEQEAHLLQNAKTIGTRTFYEPVFTYLAGEHVSSVSVFPYFSINGQVKEYCVALGCERSFMLLSLHQIHHQPEASRFPQLLETITSDEKSRQRHLKRTWAWENWIPIEQERKLAEAKKLLENEQKKKRRQGKVSKDGKKSESKKVKEEKTRKSKKKKGFNVPSRQRTGLLGSARNYIQLTLLRREPVISPIRCLEASYLYHHDFLMSPLQDESNVELGPWKKDRQVEIFSNGLEESHSLFVVTSHQNKQLIAWVYNYELMELTNQSNKGKKNTPISSPKKVSYEEILRPSKTVIGTTDAEIISLQLGNLFMNQWISDSSLSFDTSRKEEEEEENSKKSRKKKEDHDMKIVPVERVRIRRRKIINRCYLFVCSIHSQVSLHTVAIRVKQNPRCLYLYELAPKRLRPPHVDYLWKGSDPASTKQPKELELSGGDSNEMALKDRSSAEMTVESPFAAQEMDADEVLWSKKIIMTSKLRHFQQLVAPDIPLRSKHSSTSITSPPLQDLSSHSGSLTNFQKGMHTHSHHSNSDPRVCHVGDCVVT